MVITDGILNLNKYFMIIALVDDYDDFEISHLLLILFRKK